jgi:carboxymethylenebutenolidase
MTIKPVVKGRSSASIRRPKTASGRLFIMTIRPPLETGSSLFTRGLARRALLGGGTLFVGMLIGGDGWAAAPQPVAEGDARLVTETVAVPGIDRLTGYLARPKAAGKRPGLLVLHDERGLDSRAKALARRFAAEGFLVLSIDFLSPSGGTPADSAQAALPLARLARDEVMARAHAALEFLQAHPACTGKVGAMGRGWGGSIANEMAVQEPTLAGAVAYYGVQPSFHLREEYQKMKSPLMQHYAGRDIDTNVGIDPFEVELRESEKTASIFLYPAVERGFDDDSEPKRFNKEAATLAWERTLAFLKKSTS